MFNHNVGPQFYGNTSERMFQLEKLRRQNLFMRMFTNEVGCVTGVNDDGTYNINVRSRAYDFSNIVARPFRVYKVGDFVTLRAIRGDHQRVEITGLSSRRAGKVNGVVEKVYIHDVG